MTCVRSCFLGRQEAWHTHAHTQKHRPLPVTKGKTLMCDFCCTAVATNLESWKDSGVIQQQSKNTKPSTNCGLSIALLGSSRAECLPVVTFPQFATVLRLRARATDPGPGPAFFRVPWCTRGLPACHAAESTREDRRPEEKSFVFRKKSVFHPAYT